MEEDGPAIADEQPQAAEPESARDWNAPPDPEAQDDEFSPFAQADEIEPRRRGPAMVILILVLAVLAAGAAYERRSGPWRLEIGPHYDRSTLGGDDFEANLGFGARAQRPLGERLRLGFTVRFDDVSALDSQYDFVEGSQWRMGVYVRPVATGVRAAYDVERNDRAAPGASPDRQRAALGYRWRLRTGWSLEGTVSYRVSRYDVDAGNRERLQELRMSASRDLINGWRVAADYRRSDNDADLPAYSYTGNRIAATIGKTF